MPDPCLALVKQRFEIDNQQILQFFIRFTGLAKKTPADRVALAVAEELVDLQERALAELGALPAAVRDRPEAREASAALEGARARAAAAADDAAFPRDELRRLGGAARARPELAALADALERAVERHRCFEARVRWLVEGTPRDELARLDGRRDADQITHALNSAFRVEGRIGEVLAINRIAQSTSVSLFFRSTREAEGNPVFRFYDTYGLLSNYLEWGADSRRGRAAVARLNAIHGRYYIPNAGMKFVLLQTAFTWIDTIDRIGHRPLAAHERLAYFQSHARLGRAMNIADISDDYDEMYGWYQEFVRANAAHAPIKTDTFETILGSSMGAAELPQLAQSIFRAARVGMDEWYRASLAYGEPSADDVSGVRAVFFTLGQLVESLPPMTFIRSLQNNPARKNYHQPDELGVGDRSPHMPALRPEEPNRGYPEAQLPIRGAGDIRPLELPLITWDEVRRHTDPSSLWIVIEGEVYDVTTFAARHPGGLDVLLAMAGRDATKAFRKAGHSAVTDVLRLNYRIGRVARAEAAAGDAEAREPTPEATT